MPWGQDELTLALPDAWTVAQVATPQVRPAPPDWPQRLAEALTRPDGSEPLGAILAGLRRDARIVLVLEDITRHSPLQQVLPLLLREIDHAGIRDDQIEVLFAAGMHRPMTPEQVREKIGPLADRFRWRCNDYRHRSAHEHVGSVPVPGGRGRLEVYLDRALVRADLRLIVSGVSPHLQAGFGGGAKMIAPGCAHVSTISDLHFLGLPRQARPLVGTDVASNPMRPLVDAAGDLLDAAGGRTFAVQYLLDERDLPLSIVAGDLRHGQRMLAKLCAAAAGIPIEAPADILITSAWPRDFDLWQSFKCIANTRWAVRENGVIIVLARCPGGMNMPSPMWPLSPGATRKMIRWLGVRGIVSLVNRLMPGVNHEARFFVQLATETIYRNPILVYAPELLRRGQRFPGLPLYDDLGKLFADAESRLEIRGRRAIVFPSGGASYPVLT